MNAVSTSQPFFARRLMAGATLLLSLISLTIGDKAELSLSSLSSSIPSPNELNHSEQLSVLPPRKLALFAKALQKVVQSRCPRVDDLELDTFQAYLNRQILKGEVQTLRHPLHFNSLYQTLTGCANFLISSSSSASDHYLDDHGDARDDDEGRSNKRGSFSHPSQTDMGLFTSTPSGLETTSSSSATSGAVGSTLAVKNLEELAKPKNDSRGDPSTERAGSTAAMVTATANPDAEERPEEVVSSEGNGKTKWTIITRIVEGAVNFAVRIVKAAVNFFGGLFRQSSHSFFGRKKRDVTHAEEGDNEKKNKDRKSSAFYSLKPIELPAHLKNDDSGNDYKDNNYNEIWKSVTATESKMTAYVHVIQLLKNFIGIAVEVCPEKFRVEEAPLMKVSEFIAAQVMDDLVEGENQGMVLSIDEKLEKALQTCADNLSQSSVLK